MEPRFRQCRTDLEMLRELNDIDDFRWLPVESKFPPDTAVAARWRKAFSKFGLIREEAALDGAAARMAASLIRNRLLASLDLWLVVEPNAGALGVLREADSDPYRTALRITFWASCGATRKIGTAPSPPSGSSFA